jgi:hypothetical protein
MTACIDLFQVMSEFPASLGTATSLIPIGESEPISLVRGEPSELTSILVSASEAPFQKAFRPWSGPTGEPSRQGSASSFRSRGGVPLSD